MRTARIPHRAHKKFLRRFKLRIEEKRFTVVTRAKLGHNSENIY